MTDIAIIGGGITGLAVARLLSTHHTVRVYEAEQTVGGLIRCERVEGNLFHTCGGHVFNTKRSDVADWFWQHFDREQEFRHATRNSAVVLTPTLTVPYPIENNVWRLPQQTQASVINDLLTLGNKRGGDFESFLKSRFGRTLYELYFQPYNEKIWRQSLATVPLDWLEGKLPMPTVEEILLANFNHAEEHTFVHSSFYYPVSGGSQFIADRMACGLDIATDCPVQHIAATPCGTWQVAGEEYRAVVYTGDIRQLPTALAGKALAPFAADLAALQAHGTTTALVQLDDNPYSWLYQPSRQHDSHRIIMTGNFAPANNAAGVLTATVEFTDCKSEDDIRQQLLRMPYAPRYLAHRYHPLTYPVQSQGTRALIDRVRHAMLPQGLTIAGRFAEWEYYNMDAAIAAAMRAATDIERYITNNQP